MRDGRDLCHPNSRCMHRTEKSAVYAGYKRRLHGVKAKQRLFALLWIGVIYMFFYMPISSLYPLISMSYFGGTPAHASAAEIAFAVGMLLGGIILSIWGGFKRRTHTICFSVLLMGISITVSGLLPSGAFLIFIVCCTAMGIAAPFYGVQNAIFKKLSSLNIWGEFFVANKCRIFCYAVGSSHFRTFGREVWS